MARTARAWTLVVASLAQAAPQNESSDAPGNRGVASKTQVAVLGMIHGGHETSELWGLAAVRATLERFAPDAVLVEIPPDRWPQAEAELAAGLEITEERVRAFPEYRGCVLHWAREHGVDVLPCAGWTRRLNDLRRARLAEFTESDVWAAARSDYDARIAAVTERWAADPLGDPAESDDPLVIHSGRYDQRVREEYEIYDEVLNDWLGPGGWSNVNRAHLELIGQALDAHPGERLLITFGAGHKYRFLEALARRPDVELVDLTPYLPRSAGVAALATERVPDVLAIPSETEMMQQIETEIRELHAFFEAWLAGSSAADDLARVERALASDFEIVSPDGRTRTRAELLELLGGARGGRADASLAIRITDVGVRVVSRDHGRPDAWLASYVEHHDTVAGAAGEAVLETRARRSTALFGRGADGRPVWRHVHETWIGEGP